MIDWHSHILPNMDDGSRDEGESLALLEELKQQGVDCVVATPHFYANHDSMESFLTRRGEAFAKLKECLPTDAPKVFLGAEVRYYAGISRLENIKKLCVEGTRLFLLEMPMSKWTEYTVRELIELASRGDVRLVLAHIDRYWKLQKSNVWKRLYQSGILMQVNADFFNERGTRRQALKLMKKGGIRFIGSDCHNMADRKPEIGKAFELIAKKLGADFLEEFQGYGYSKLFKK